MSKDAYYITTAIDYVNAEPHMGHAYEKIGADAMARFKRLQGRDVRFTVGTDEHGQKVAEAAEARGIDPMVHVDATSARFKEAWRELELSHDDFIRTTEERHRRSVEELFRRIEKSGDLFEGDYVGWYCKYDEAFWPETKLVGGNCPTCDRPVDQISERNMFFRLSRYTEPLRKYFDEHREFILPTTRRQEMLNILEEGLEDLSISRANLRWGIPLPGSDHVLYVWFDALINYITSVGFPDDAEKFQRYWPASVHVIGKDIVKFHSIIWPAMLMSAGLPLPRHVFVHGFVLTPTGKMSKSVGNVIAPGDIARRYGADALRYGLLREISWGQDGIISEEILHNRYTRDLGNDLGNLLHRVLSMIGKHFDGVVPVIDPSTASSLDEELWRGASKARKTVSAAYEEMGFNLALDAAWGLVRAGNQYIDKTEPWKWAAGKLGDQREADETPDTDQARARLGTILASAAEALRQAAVLVAPAIPGAAGKIWHALGIDEPMTWAALDNEGAAAGKTTVKGQPLFPRMDPPTPKEASSSALLSSEKKSGPKKADAGEVSYDQFMKTELRVATITLAEKVEKADKLLRIELSLGEETRQVVAGIAQSYDPSRLIGMKVVLVANLKPARIRGVESHGMLLASTGADGRHRLIDPGDVPEGGRIQ